MNDLGLKFIRLDNHYKEEVPANVPPREVARYLAEKKAEFNASKITDQVMLTADTIVIADDRILVKPMTYREGYSMLSALSGTTHEVVTGVCLRSREKTISFSETTYVHFRPLADEEIDFYLRKFMPYDKAGAYGIQEWLGMIGIDRIEGSYYNVVGLPIHRIYEELVHFI